MTYKVCLVDQQSLMIKPWWENYRATIDLRGNYWADELVAHNGRDIAESDDEIEFETEEDFIIFKLKFS